MTELLEVALLEGIGQRISAVIRRLANRRADPAVELTEAEQGGRAQQSTAYRKAVQTYMCYDNDW